MVDPRMFAPVNLGEILSQAEQLRGQREDRQYRLQALMQRRQEQEAESRRTRDSDFREQIQQAATWAETPERWEQALDWFQGQGHDVSRYRGRHDLRGMFLKPEREAAPIALQRTVEYYRSIGRPDLAEQYLTNQADPIVQYDVDSDGDPDILPRSEVNRMMGIGAPAPAPQADLPLVNSPEEARRLPPGTEFRTPDGRRLRVPGGQTPSASGNFPG